MIQAASAANIDMFYFYPSGVKSMGGDIEGLYWHRGLWGRYTFPYPRVIYNRIVYRRNEAQPGVAKLVRVLNDAPSLIFFNSRFLNKCEVERTLDNEPSLAEFRLKYAPLAPDSLGNMTERHGEVFIKLCSGNTAQGLCKVIRNEAGYFRYSFFRKGHPVSWRQASDLHGLYRVLQHSYGTTPAFIQEGLRLARWQGRIFDLRVLVQKNGRGQWQLAARAGRVAGDAGAFVTHVPNGGRAVSFEQLITSCWGRAAYAQTVPLLDRLAVNAAAALERYGDLQLGVLSMDIGMDAQGRLKLFEINSKPAGFDEPELRRQHYTLLMQYFNYLLDAGPGGKEAL
ncbi:MAG: YheC/YheD family protein [Syntrophomonadaceae bacterium]|nr:YheC/YheD family protein [Syntrophomonadaceae bacterium]